MSAGGLDLENCTLQSFNSAIISVCLTPQSVFRSLAATSCSPLSLSSSPVIHPQMARSFNSLVWDYAVFFLFLVMSSIVPLWSQLFGKKKEKSKADYVFAAGKVTIFAMMMSIARGTLGVRSFLGYPSELFYRGASMWETIYGMMTAYPIVLYVFIPVYFSLGITSVYQYLDLR